MEVILKFERRLRVGGRYCRAISLALVLHRGGLPALRLIDAPVTESHRRRSRAAYRERYGNGLAWLEGARRRVRARKCRALGATRGASHGFFDAALEFRFGIEFRALDGREVAVDSGQPVQPVAAPGGRFTVSQVRD